MNEESKPSDTGPVIQVAYDAAELQIAVVDRKDNDTVPVAKLQDGWKLRSLEHLYDRPRAIAASVTLHDMADFCTYVKAYKAADVDGKRTIIFMDKASAKMKAFLDYHGAQPSWCQHTAEGVPTYSDQFRVWEAISGKVYAQVAFGKFLEDHLDDITAPKGAEILTLVLDFQAVKNAKLVASQRLDNGQVQFQYIEEISASGKTTNLLVPTTIMLNIPVFFGQPARPIELRFRYTVESDKLAMGVEIAQKDKLLNDARQELRELVEASTGCVVLAGECRTTAREALVEDTE